MSKHLSFRICLLGIRISQYLEINPYENSDRTNIDRLPEELKKFLPENFNRLAFLDYEMPLEKWGEVWSRQITNGLEKINQIEQDRLLTIVYDDLIENPQDSLQKLLKFLGKEFVDESWIEKAASIVKTPRSSWRDLPEKEQNLLIESCLPGMDELKKSGIVIPDPVTI